MKKQTESKKSVAVREITVAEAEKTSGGWTIFNGIYASASLATQSVYIAPHVGPGQTY